MRRKGNRKYKKQGEKRGLRVDVRNNNVEFALKKFKRMVKDSGLMLELKKKTYYEKPSVKRREKNEAHLYMTLRILLEDSFCGHQVCVKLLKRAHDISLY